MGEIMNRFGLLLLLGVVLSGCVMVAEDGSVQRVRFGKPGLSKTMDAANDSTAMPSEAVKGVYSVSDFGAQADGIADDTAAIQTALNAAASDGGGMVLLSAGSYKIASRLVVPEFVTLEGVWRGPVQGVPGKGTMLLAGADRGKANGVPFITLKSQANLRGVSIFYPEQPRSGEPVAYPWSISGDGDGCSIIDVQLINSYQGIDLGSNPSRGHFVRRVQGQPLYRGIYVDRTQGDGSLADITFTPEWRTDDEALRFMQDEGISFIFGQTRSERLTNLTSRGYNIGLLANDFGSGVPGILADNLVIEETPTALRVEQSSEQIGVSVSNSMLSAGVEVEVENRGPIRFNMTSFAPISDTAYHAALAGAGPILFNGCHFTDWDMDETGRACITSDAESITIIANQFMAEGKRQVHLGKSTRSAIFTSNHFNGGPRITNASDGEIRFQYNAAPTVDGEPFTLRSHGRPD
jgi:Pectate lyase superfamily protein